MNEKIREIVAQALETDIEKITENSSMDSFDNWDSIHHLQLIILLEREFNIKIPDRVVGNMISYKLIEEVVNECKRS